MPDELSFFGASESLKGMADRVSAAGIFDDRHELRRLLDLAALHMRGAARRLESRASAQRNADEKMTRALAKLHGVDVDNGFDPRGFYVYVLWGSDDATPLYVGQSTNVLSRLGGHLGDRAKRGAVERVTLVRCRDAKTMNATELRMIRHFRPPWNKVGLTSPSMRQTGAGAIYGPESQPDPPQSTATERS